MTTTPLNIVSCRNYNGMDIYYLFIVDIVIARSASLVYGQIGVWIRRN